MQFPDVVTRLEDAFTRELPGAAAQAHLAPIPRRQWPDGFREEQVRHAAGLLLVFPTALNAEPAETAEPDGTVRVPRPPSRSWRPESRAKDGSLSRQAHILLAVRADTLGRHGGQVSLPGGVVDAGETFEQAALREA